MKNKMLLGATVIAVMSMMGSATAEYLVKPALFGLCESCHGVGAKSTMDGYPTLAGQNKLYLINSINAYKNGERSGGLSALMIPMSKMMADDASVEEMATYLNSLK